MQTTFLQRLALIRGADDECWHWRWSVTKYGYGRVCENKHQRRLHAHRAAYLALVGPVPDGLVLDHLCRNKLCCNPAHLEPVTIWENVRRADTIMSKKAAQTHCERRGHAFTPENTWMHKRRGRKPSRECKKCMNERSIIAHARRRQRQATAVA